MRRFLMLWLLLAPVVLVAQEVAGTWNGTLTIENTKLRLLFHLTQTAEGWQATMDSPDQGARGIPVDSVAVTPAGITLAIKPLRLNYTAGFLGNNLVGVLTQMGRTYSMILTRGAGARPNRPQEPQPPYPYHSEEVVFTGRDGAVTLHGTLTRPKGEGRYPAVVLVSGSGTQNRDEEIRDHKPFLVLADRLTRAGYAVLRYDDRGYNVPKEELIRLQGTTTADLMQDALGAFDYLRAHASIRADRIGIAGHSEGGTIAFLAAAAEPQTAFVVSMAGMVMAGHELLVTQNRIALQQSGVPQPVADAYAEALRRLYDSYLTHTPETFAADEERLLGEAVAGLALPEVLQKNLEQAIRATTRSAWIDYFVRLDPAEAVRRAIDRPCLAINGERDSQVDAEQNLSRLAELAGDAPTVTIIRYEGLNHLFQPCTTGAVTEYGQIETTIDERVPADLVAWLERVTR